MDRLVFRLAFFPPLRFHFTGVVTEIPCPSDPTAINAKSADQERAASAAQPGTAPEDSVHLRSCPRTGSCTFKKALRPAQVVFPIGDTYVIWSYIPSREIACEVFDERGAGRCLGWRSRRFHLLRSWFNNSGDS
jgi:hypothetical protein